MPAARLRKLSHDAIAGTVTAVLLVPQALAYALLAGLPPEAGLYAAMAPALAYAAFGTSPALSVGPVAVVSLMTATALSAFDGGSAEHWQAALLLALFSGAMLFALGAMRLGVLINFLSYPVISGFAMGAAVLIILSQLPQILGLRVAAAGDAVQQARHLLAALPATALQPLAIGCSAIACLIAAQAALPRWLAAAGVPRPYAALAARSMPLLLVVAGALYAARLPAADGALQLVGHLSTGVPHLQWPASGWSRWRELLGPAALIGLVGYLEGISIAQVLARRHRHEVKANRELVATGLANMVAALTQGMPVAGSLSRSVVNDAAGARTRLAGVVAAGLVAASALVAAPLLDTLPRAVLAAIIIVAVLRLLDGRALLRVWRYDRADGLAWVVTTLGVLAVGAETGFVAGLAVSLLLYIWRTANPHIVEVGHVPNTDLFVEADRHHELELWPQLLLVRIDESLFFGNAAAVQNFVTHKLAARAQVTDVILICSAVNSIDGSALQMLEDLADSLAQGGVTLHLAELKGPVMDRLEGTSLQQRLGRRRLHASAAAAIIALASPPI